MCFGGTAGVCMCFGGTAGVCMCFGGTAVCVCVLVAQQVCVCVLVAQQVCVYVFWWHSSVFMCFGGWICVFCFGCCCTCAVAPVLLHLCCCICAIAAVLLHLCYCICAFAPVLLHLCCCTCVVASVLFQAMTKNLPLIELFGLRAVATNHFYIHPAQSNPCQSTPFIQAPSLTYAIRFARCRS